MVANGSRILNFHFNQDELDKLDKLVKIGGYKNRSDCIKSLINDKMKGVPTDETRNAVIDLLKNDEEIRATFYNISEDVLNKAFSKLMSSK